LRFRHGLAYSLRFRRRACMRLVFWVFLIGVFMDSTQLQMISRLIQYTIDNEEAHFEEVFQMISRLIQYTIDNEEAHFEEVLEEFGLESDQVREHAYTLAWNIATELRVTF